MRMISERHTQTSKALALCSRDIASLLLTFQPIVRVEKFSLIFSRKTFLEEKENNKKFYV